MFAIQDFLEAKLASVTPRSEVHGDDEKPAVSFALSITTSGEILDSIDKDLRGAAFRHSKSKTLPGVPDVPTVLACNSVDYIVLDKKYEGWTLEVDDGIDGNKPMTFGGCKIDGFKVEPLQGGSVTLRMRVGTSDIDAQRSGMLNMHVGQSIWIKATPPKPGEGKQSPNGKAAEPDATDMFVEQHGNGAKVDKKATSVKKSTPAKKAPAKAAPKGKDKPGKR
jgi:hypothetical protein